MEDHPPAEGPVNQEAPTIRTRIEKKVEESVRESFRENRTKWWQINPAQMVTIATTLVLAVAAFTKLQQTAEISQKAIESLYKRVDDMDRDGTQSSKMKIQLDHQMIDSHEKRIQKMEDSTSGYFVVVEKLDRQREDILELKEALKQIRTTQIVK